MMGSTEESLLITGNQEKEGINQMEMDAADSGPENGRRFDRRLPVTHSYLGNIQEGELPGESLFEEPESDIKVPVLVMSDVCLLPGQRMPLQFYTEPALDFFKDPDRQRHYFGLMTAQEERELENAEDFSRIPCHFVGVLFQIQNAFVNGEGRITLQVIGRQRCKLISPLFRHNIHCEDLSMLICDNIFVRVLEEKLLFPGILSLPESSLNRLSKREKQKWFFALTPHTTFTICQLSTNGLVLRLVKWLLNWFNQRQIELVLEQGLTVFSFWVAANIPMSLEKKLELLREDSTDRRFRIEWRIVSQMSSVVCIDCDDQKCTVSDIINLSVDGNSTHFVNPGGFVHDLFTVKRIHNIELDGPPSAGHSWFPGYEWTIVICAACHRHIGWRFTSPQLIPQQFYGISRRSFRLACPKETLE